MLMKDAFSRLKATDVLAPATRTATATGTVVDLQGYRMALILMRVGVGGITFDATNNVNFQLQESDDDSSYADVDITKVNGLSDASLTGGIVRRWTAAKAAASLNVIAYTGGKRYLKLINNFNGTHGTGTLTSAVVVLGEPNYVPANTPIAVAN